jgi:hypothetical protein
MSRRRFPISAVIVAEHREAPNVAETDGKADACRRELDVIAAGATIVHGNITLGRFDFGRIMQRKIFQNLS